MTESPYRVVKVDGVFVFTGPAGVRLLSKGESQDDFDKLLQNATQDRGQSQASVRLEQIRAAFNQAAQKYGLN